MFVLWTKSLRINTTACYISDINYLVINQISYSWNATLSLTFGSFTHNRRVVFLKLSWILRCISISQGRKIKKIKSLWPRYMTMYVHVWTGETYTAKYFKPIKKGMQCFQYVSDSTKIRCHWATSLQYHFL